MAKLAACMPAINTLHFLSEVLVIRKVLDKFQVHVTFALGKVSICYAEKQTACFNPEILAEVKRNQLS